MFPPEVGTGTGVMLTGASGCVAAADMVVLCRITHWMLGMTVYTTICFVLIILGACTCALAVHLNLLVVPRWLVLIRNDAIFVRNFAPEPVRAHMLSTLQSTNVYIRRTFTIWWTPPK